MMGEENAYLNLVIGADRIQRDEIVSKVVSDFDQAGLLTNKTAIGLALVGITSSEDDNVQTEGDYFESKGYDLTPSEIHVVWEAYKRMHNHMAREEGDLYEITFDPTNWRELTDYLVEAAKLFAEIQKPRNPPLREE